MTHEYAKEIHQFIAEKIEESETARQKADATDDKLELSYQEGKLKEFLALRKLINESFDLSTQKYF